MALRAWPSVGVLVASLALIGPRGAQEADGCWESVATFRSEQWPRQFDGPEARAELATQVEAMIGRYRTEDRDCTDRLIEYRVLLIILDNRFEAVVEEVERHLDERGDDADVSHRIRMEIQRAYALERLGEIRQSSQGYFSAASRARNAEAYQGVRALVDAAVSAEILRDYDSALRYLDAATRLVSDSLSNTDWQWEYTGTILATKASVLDAQIQALEEGTERRARIADLRDTAQRALDALSRDQDGLTLNRQKRTAGFRALAASRYALALALQGDYERALQQRSDMLASARQAGAMLPNAEFEVWEQMSRVAELGGDIALAKHAASRAREEAIRLGNGLSERSMLRRLGDLAEREGRWRDAATLYTEAVAREETYRERLGLQDWTAQAFGRVEDAYRGLVRAHLALDAPRAAFVTLDQTRARYLRDMRRHLAVRSRLDSDLRVQADSTQRALEEARLLLLRDGLTAPERATATYSISALQERLEDLTGTPPEEPDDLDLGALQDTLDARGQVLVSYFLDPVRSTAFVVRPDTFVAVSLDTTPARISELLDRAGAPWREGVDGADPAFDLGALHDIYDEVLASVRPWLPVDAALVVIPDRAIGDLPFGMLPSEPADDYASAPYLVRDHTVTTELAASMVTEAVDPQRPSDPSLDLLAYGRSSFGTIGSTWNAPLDDLPYVREEVKAIARGVASRLVALDDEATESSLDRHLGDARIVHIASHAEPNTVLPLYSRIALWDQPDTPDDGIVHLYELQGRALPAELVVLSGCSTARGRHVNGEGVIGLQYAVRTAGAASSLATLWPVDDRASVELMDGFYDGLRRGLSKGEALRRAQLAYLDEHEGLEASPFFWAGPILSGDVAPVYLETRAPITAGVAVLLTLLGVGVAWGLYRRRRLNARTLVPLHPTAGIDDREAQPAHDGHRHGSVAGDPTPAPRGGPAGRRRRDTGTAVRGAGR